MSTLQCIVLVHLSIHILGTLYFHSNLLFNTDFSLKLSILMSFNVEFTPTVSPTRPSSCKKPKDPDRALFESLQKRVAESGSILKDLSKAQQQPITSRTSFASYIKDSLLTMSRANFKKARSSINRLLTDLMDEESDDGDDMPAATGISSIPATQQTTHPQKSHQLCSSSASSFSSFSSSELSTSEQYQPAPHLWRNVPPASSVWGSQSMEFMEQYHQQPLQHPHQQMPTAHQQIIPQQKVQQCTTTPSDSPVSNALGYASQVLRDKPSPTLPISRWEQNTPQQAEKKY